MDTKIPSNYQEQRLIEFEDQLEHYVDKLNDSSDRTILKNIITNEFKELTHFFISLCDDAFNSIAKPRFTFLVNYRLCEIYKDLLILHRDVFLELHKASIYLKEKSTSETIVNNHFNESKLALKEAVKEFSAFIFSEKNELTQKSHSSKKLALKLTLEKNPYTIYKSQFTTLLSQLEEISYSQVQLLSTISIFNNLKKIASEVNAKHTSFVDTISKSLDYLLEQGKEKINSDDLLLYVDDTLLQLQGVDNLHQSFPNLVNLQINQLNTLYVPVSAIDGLLAKRDVDFKKKTQKWFDYKVLPSIMDLMGLETSLANKYNLNLINLKNSFQLSKQNDNIDNSESIINSLNQLKEELKTLSEKGKNITQEIIKNIDKHLSLTNLLKGDSFLDVPFNSSLSIEGNTFIKSIKNSIKTGGSYINSKYKQSLVDESLSNLELSTLCIAHRMFKDNSIHYDSLFLNKQFIGDLFLVSRKSQEEKLKLIIDQWHKGFNKSVLLIGDRLSGRTTFLDYTSKKFFNKDIVNLRPNSDAIIDGRKFSTTNDLKQALEYVKNNNIKSTKPIILIDDLELWRDDKKSLLDNLRALSHFIETESDESFVMVATTPMFLKHVNNRMNFSNTFSHTITINEASKDEITEAILVRHSVAHRDLVSEDLEPISTKKIQSLSHTICKNTNNNFGNALQSWTYHTFVQENEKVLFKESYYEFTDFFTQQEVIILKQALIFKYISEYGLIRVMSSSFEEEYKSAIRRLVNIKVLIRGAKGALSINPVIVNDVERIITNKITFN